MSGFFPYEIANKFTEQCNHLLDWSRVGELLASTTHRYSMNELIQRGFIVSSMVYGAYSGYNIEVENGFQAGFYSMAGCFIGFVVSHIAVITPLIYKRYQMSNECSQAQNEILSLLQKLNESDSENANIGDLIKIISGHVDATMKLNLSDEKHSNASITWGKRKSLINAIKNALGNDLKQLKNSSAFEDVFDFWSRDTATIHKELIQQQQQPPSLSLKN